MRRGLLFLVLAWALAAAPGPPALAAGNPEQDPRAQRLLELLEKEDYIAAREGAEALLRADRGNPVALYVLGVVFQEAEGNLPRAYHCLTEARRRLEKGGRPPPSDGPWQTHLRVLWRLANVLEEMDDYRGCLRVLADHDRWYAPEWTDLYGWPLMKLGRYDEARRKMLEVLTDRAADPEDRARALNTLGAIESEADNPDESLKWHQQLVDETEARGWERESTYYSNLGLAYLAVLNYSKAEKYYLEATRLFHPYLYANPWDHLANLYTAENRLPEALSAVRRMHQWARAKKPHLVQQDWAELQTTTASVLLAAGFDQDALRLMQRVLNRPDRRGGTSGQAYEAEAARLTVYYVLLQEHRQRLGEEMSWLGPPAFWLGVVLLDLAAALAALFFSRRQGVRMAALTAGALGLVLAAGLGLAWRPWLRDAWESYAVLREIWQVRSRVAALVVAHDMQRRALIPYGSEALTPTWLRPVLAEMVGPGVVNVELRRLLARSGPRAAREKPFLLEYRGEARLLQGRSGSAVEDLRQALESLPREEALLRLRARALLARALLDQGRRQEALPLYQEAMEANPGLFRQLGLRLPVNLRPSGDPLARRAAATLGRSPRFRKASWGFPLEVSGGASGLQAVLKGLDGTVLASVSTAPKGDVDLVRQFCQDVHQQAFATKLDLTQQDINSLDGSATSGSSVREQLEQMFSPGGR
ncbi:MAG TPA: tetratricopeptide repeat protein [Candidatus Nitrosotenuis sp.]|jgi:tetratricopeptide (TPR) repeat protein|nr:tetratricopeptide repeat protein [Candidatus Nitrosotenuis sp.]